MSEQPLLQEMPKQYNRYEPDDIVAGRPIRNGIFYSQRGSYIYQILPDQAHIINAVTGQTVHKIRYNQNAHAISAIYRATYNYLLIGLSNNTLMEIDCDNFKLGLTYYLQGKPISLSLSNDESVLGIGQSNGYVQLIDLTDQQIIQMDIPKQNSSIFYLNIFPNNLMVTISAERNMRIYENYKQKQLITELPDTKHSHVVSINLWNGLMSKKYDQLHQALDIQEYQLDTIMLLADDNSIQVWMQNTTSSIDFKKLFQDGTPINAQLKEMLTLMGMQEFPSSSLGQNSTGEAKAVAQAEELKDVINVNMQFMPFSRVSQTALEKSRGKIQSLSFHRDILFVVSTSGIEVFRVQEDVLRSRARRVRRTVKQRLERIEAQIKKKATSPNYVQEKAQIFAQIDFLTFKDLFISVGFIPVRPEQRFAGHSVHYYGNHGNNNDNQTVGKLLAEFLDERHHFMLELVGVMDGTTVGGVDNEVDEDVASGVAPSAPGKRSRKTKKIEKKMSLVPQSVSRQSHATIPAKVSLNDEDTLIVTADGWRQLFFTVRRCSLVASVELPDNFGRPLAQFVLPGGTYTVLVSGEGFALITSVARQEVESMVQVLNSEVSDIIISAQLYNDVLIVFSRKGQVSEFSFQMQSGTLQLVQERSWESGYELSGVLVTPKLTFFAVTDGSVRVHHRDTFKFKMALYGHSLPVTHLLLSPTNEKLFTLSSGDKTLRSWGLTFGECLRIIKLQDQPTCFTLISGTNNAIIATTSGKLLQYDLDTYQQVSILCTGNFGQIIDPGHNGPVTSITSSKNGKLVISCSGDCCKTWIQGDDVFTVESEQILRDEMRQETEAVATAGRGQKWGETLHGVNLSSLDLLQETIERCYEKFQAKQSQNEENQHNQNQTQNDAQLNQNAADNVLQQLYEIQEREKRLTWEEELHTAMFAKISRAVLPELIRALPSAVADKLLCLLLTRLQTASGGADELHAWALIRLVKTVYPGRLGENAETASQLTVKIFDQLLLKNGACLGLLNGFDEA